MLRSQTLPSIHNDVCEYFRKIALTTSLRKARRVRVSSSSSLLIPYMRSEEQHRPSKQTWIK